MCQELVKVETEIFSSENRQTASGTRQSTMDSGRKYSVNISRELNWLRFLDVGAYLILGVVTGMHWHNDRHHWIGAVISVPAFFLWMLARHQIGASFAVRARAKKLVKHGLYSRIRHPIYIFGGLAFLGEFLALGWYIWTSVFVLINLSQYLRIKREEQVLSEAFGEEYRAYKASTWF